MKNGIPESRVYLCGFMGAGKTTVGKLLSDRLDWPFTDLDDFIEEFTGSTIPEIFDSKGESRFREIEQKCLRKVSLRPEPLVVATGGGLPVDEKNREIMRETGVPVLLKVSAEVAYERIKGDSNRPNLGDFNNFKELWTNRQDAYNSISIQIDANRSEPGAIANDTIESLRSENF